MTFGQYGATAIDIHSHAAIHAARDPTAIDPSLLPQPSMSVTSEGFQQRPVVGAQPVAGFGGGLFLYGIDVGGESFGGAGAPTGGRIEWNPYAIQLQGGTPAVPDADGDGKGDSYFIQFSGLQSAC